MFVELVIAIVLGYGVGSISPSYFLGRLIRKLDIRQHGDGNAGTVNTYKVLGLLPSAITAVIDVSKGVLIFWFSYRVLHFSLTIALAAGFAAIVGHVFPFYLNFRGGQGVATATGFLLFCLAQFIHWGWFPIYNLCFLAFVALTFGYISRKGEVVGSVVLPLLLFLILQSAPLNTWTVFFVLIVIYILLINFINLIHRRVMVINPEVKARIKWWRFLLRPLAILFPIFFQLIGEKPTLVLLGIITLIFLGVDLIRLSHRGVNIFFFRNLPMFFKTKETQRISSMSLFLIATFLVLLLFQYHIALMTILYLIFGDLFGKFFGMQFGKIHLFGKSLEGSLAFFTACLISGIVLSHYIPITFLTLFVGALAATLAELLPLGVDDNFTVALISASTMYVTQIF
ncbi:glycerol-3-phosphate acyltransferase [bacterium]|nr:glycerol-3-phosphate acyltransferase [bacterium]